VRVNAAFLAAGLALVGCDDPPPDPELATPLTTARTLLRAYHLHGLTEAQLKRRLRRGLTASSDKPVDVAAQSKCFVDFDPDDMRSRSLAVFVVGTLAARQDRLRESRSHDRGTIFVPDEMVIVLERTAAGWQILLEQSVPAAIRGHAPTL